MKIPPHIVAWPVAAYVLLLRWTCRLRVHDDPRPLLKSEGRKYIYSVLHAHQIGASMYAEAGTMAMVSRSRDGELIVRMLRWMGAVPVRGSSRRKDSRGGAEALDAMAVHVNSGRPAILAVDGPRGPRGHVRKGVASLASRTGASVLNVVLVPRWRLTMPKTWDRFQIPLPFGRIDAYFAPPVCLAEDEKTESLRRRVESTLLALEQAHDPAEVKLAAVGRENLRQSRRPSRVYDSSPRNGAGSTSKPQAERTVRS